MLHAKMPLRILTALSVACLSLGATAATAQASPDQFTLFDNTSYTSVTIGHGAVKSNLVPNSTCTPLTQAGAMPTQSQWQSIVESDDVNPDGVLVLDCEDLYLTGSATTAQTHYNQMLQLQEWARDAEPTQIIGWYGLLGNTSSGYYSYYQELLADDSNTAFFPSAYTFSANEDSWDSNLSTVMSDAAAISSSTAIYPYVWPQYHSGSSPSTLDLTFIPGGQWSYELAAIEEEGLAGAVVWGGGSNVCDSTCQSEAASAGWLAKTQNFLDFLSTPRTDVAFGKSATASSTYGSGWGPANATDGDPMTRWISDYSDPQWVTVDLGAEYDISGVRFLWDGYATSYKVQISDNDTDWTTVYSTTTGQGGITFHPGAQGTGRYVRMYGTARGTQYGYALWDFNVYGTLV